MGLGGRSKCPECGAKISWLDNIPVLSFLLLRGKCRNCRKEISWRYPTIEIGFALVFLSLVVASRGCFFNKIVESNPVCGWSNALGMLSYLFYLLLSILFITVFVIDLRNKIILDQLSFLGLLLVVISLLLFRGNVFFLNMLVGFVSAAFLLLIHLLTRGRGMGLGDVKFAIFTGALLGWPASLVWMFLAFLTGALVGIILVLRGSAKLKSQIVFGPFLVFAAFVAFIVGRFLIDIYLQFI